MSSNSPYSNISVSIAGPPVIIGTREQKRKNHLRVVLVCPWLGIAGCVFHQGLGAGWRMLSSGGNKFPNSSPALSGLHTTGQQQLLLGHRSVGYGRKQICPLGSGELCGETGPCPGALGEAPTLRRCPCPECAVRAAGVAPHTVQWCSLEIL